MHLRRMHLQAGSNMLHIVALFGSIEKDTIYIFICIYTFHTFTVNSNYCMFITLEEEAISYQCAEQPALRAPSMYSIQ